MYPRWRWLFLPDIANKFFGLDFDRRDTIKLLMVDATSSVFASKFGALVEIEFDIRQRST